MKNFKIIINFDKTNNILLKNFELFNENYKINIFLKFYRDHLKKIKILRFCAIKTYNIFCYFQNLILKKLYLKNYSNFIILNLSDYCKQNKIDKCIIKKKHEKNLSSKQSLDEKIYSSIISDAVVFGKCNIVFKDNEAIIHDLIEINKHVISEEYNKSFIVDYSRNIIRVNNDTFIDFYEISNAASFLDGTSTNYAHWITEILPRIALFCSEEKFKDIPIIIDDSLHKNIMESLTLFTRGRKIYIVPRQIKLIVKKLYLTSVTGYVPIDIRRKYINTKHGGFFDSYSLQLVRNFAITNINKFSNKIYPKKIFITRSSNLSKKINNIESLQIYLEDNGFTIINTENLSFFEQVKYFNSADNIICSSGSALSNLIFANPGCIIQVPIINHKKANYDYWKNIASAVGLSINYILDPVESSSNDVHSDFFVDFKLLKL